MRSWKEVTLHHASSEPRNRFCGQVCEKLYTRFVQRSAPLRAIDPRPARTRAAIYRAVERLTTDIEGEVSVNAIVRAAGVSRSAFYAQFADLDGLAVAMLVDSFRDIGADDVDARRSGSVGLRGLARSSNTRLVAHVAARRRFYRASLDWRLTSQVHETVVSAYADQVAETMRALGARMPDHVDRDDTARFVAGGAVAMLTAWLRSAEPCPQDRLVSRLLAVMPDWLVGSD